MPAGTAGTHTETPADADVRRSLEDMVAVLGPRSVSMYRLRNLEGWSLMDVGQAHDVSRERARQLVRQCENRISKALGGEARFQWLRDRSRSLARTWGRMVPEDHPRTASALETALDGIPDDLRWLARSMLIEAAGPYVSKRGWLVRAVDDELMALVRNLGGNPKLLLDTLDRDHVLLHASDDDGRMFRAAVEYTLSGQGVNPAFHDAWMQSHQMRQFDDCWVSWPHSMLERCAGMLAVLQRPATAAELVEAAGGRRSVRGMRSRMLQDARFVRVDKTHLALSTWGLAPYGGISDEIRKIIVAAGGEVPVDEVVDALVEKFGVRPVSVRVYMRAAIFDVRGRHVRMREAGRDGDVGSGVPRSQTVRMNVPVNAEALRGSGRPCSMTLCRNLGIGPGESRDFAAGGEIVRVGWPATSPTPHLGSIRNLLQSLQARVGDRLVLTFNGTDNTVDAALHHPGDKAEPARDADPAQ